MANTKITSANLDTNIAVSGTLTVGSHLSLGDSDILKIGASSDLQLYHDGTDSNIQNSTGNLYVYGGSNHIRIRPTNNQESVLAYPAGQVELYYAGAKKFETASGGVTVTGDITISDATPTLTFTDTDNNYDATIAGLSGSLVLTADSGAEFGTETIQFHTGGSQRVTINASGNVGIKNTSPTAQLHIGANSVSGALGLGLQNDSRFYTINTDGGNLTFKDESAATERMRIASDGVITIGSSSVGTDRIKFVGNTNIGAPDTSNHDQGTRINLYDSSSTAWYAIGINSNTMWFQSDTHYNFYVDASQKIKFDTTNAMPVVRVGTDSTNAMRLGTVTAVFPYSGPSFILAQAGAALTAHSGTNTTGAWQNLATDFPDYLVGTATFNTINTSQQANIIVYLNVATKTYLVRDSGWNAVSTSGWIRISDDNVYSTGTSQVWVKYLEPGTYSLDNDSALYFFEAPIGP